MRLSWNEAEVRNRRAERYRHLKRNHTFCSISPLTPQTIRRRIHAAHLTVSTVSATSATGRPPLAPIEPSHVAFPYPSPDHPARFVNLERKDGPATASSSGRVGIESGRAPCPGRVRGRRGERVERSEEDGTVASCEVRKSREDGRKV